MVNFFIEAFSVSIESKLNWKILIQRSSFIIVETKGFSFDAFR